MRILVLAETEMQRDAEAQERGSLDEGEVPTPPNDLLSSKGLLLDDAADRARFEAASRSRGSDQGALEAGE